MGLNNRRNPVFAVGGGEPFSYTPVIDLRICWTEADIVSSAIAGLLPGETQLASVISGGSSLDFIFEARHPLQDAYYSRNVSCITAVDVPIPYIVQTEIYHVNGEIYYVQGTVTPGLGVVATSDTYMLLDLSRSDYPTSGAKIEPFNTVFYPTGTFSDTPRIKDNKGNVFPITSTFANVDSSGYSFTLRDNKLYLSNNGIAEDPPVTPTDAILSINGVTPVDGNINISILS